MRRWLISVLLAALCCQVMLAGRAGAKDVKAKLDELNQRETHLLQKLEELQQRERYVQTKLEDLRHRKQELLKEQAVRNLAHPEASPAATPSAVAPTP
jgi:predicted nuclease with TOPRIM domain